MANRHGRLSEEIGSRKDLSKGCKLLCWALDMIHNPKTGQCNPKIAKLTEEMGDSKSSIRAYIKEAVKNGLIERRKGIIDQQDFILSWRDKSLPTIATQKVAPTAQNIALTAQKIEATAQEIEATAQKIEVVPYIMNEKEKEKEKEKEEDSFEEKEKDEEKDGELSFKEIMLLELAELRA